MRFPPAEGVCLPGSRTSEYFREVLPRLGLQAHETEDFLAAWVPRMEGAAFNVIGFHPREVVDMLAPVRVSPTPTWMIRILMDATPVEECPELQAPVLPEAVPAREGVLGRGVGRSPAREPLTRSLHHASPTFDPSTAGLMWIPPGATET
ncbi:hypothetical protein JRI60_00960 [Archangium violaceum]|uniref:hypothetical protein n=1 Tax=Archangium violaceum TaxID=83451 RepID=UPI0019508C21|nr:hypothetical protein [Archangium violaceum]QRN97691.1 hypothetical protein JRI60_00960 [Archangium violaceum]